MTAAGADLLVSGHIRTMDPSRPVAEAMVIRDGRVLFVGTHSGATTAAATGHRHLRLGDLTVLPGLTDSHNHMLWTGLQEHLLDLSGCPSIRELLDRIRRYARSHPDEEWIVSSEGWHVDDLAEDRYPTRWELDEASPHRPVYLPRVGHVAAVNSAALRIAGITAATPDVTGGDIVRDPHTGEPTGLLMESPAFDLVKRHVPKPSRTLQRQALHDVQRRYLALGITGIVDPGLTSDEIELYTEARAEGELLLRATLMPLIAPDPDPDRIAAAIRGREGHSGQGDSWLRLGGLKVFLDGGASLGTAWLRDPYPGSPDNRGMQVMTTDTLRAVAGACADSGWGLGVHAVGGAAIDCTLEVFSEIGTTHDLASLRFHLIHAYLWPSPDNIATAARLGVCVAAQPTMQELFAPMLRRRWGAAAADRATPLRDWVDAGVRIAGGSDAPLTTPDPLAGIRHAVTRNVPGLGAVGPEQALTPTTALQAYTSDAAWLAFAEHERGSLRPGMLADWIALDADPMDSGWQDPATATVRVTSVQGTIVHDNRHAASN